MIMDRKCNSEPTKQVKFADVLVSEVFLDPAKMEAGGKLCAARQGGR